MDIRLKVFVLLMAVGCTTGQDDLTVQIQGEAIHKVKAGGSLTFTCNVNQGLQVSLKYSLEWWHQSLVDQENPTEVLLTNMEALQDDASPDVYGIKVDYGNDYMNLVLTIKEVKVEHDGKFLCRLTPLSGDGDKLENAVELVVVNDVQSVALTFDGEAPVTGETDVTVEREEGEYSASCLAEGFSPEASIHIFLGDDELTTGGTEIMPDKEASAAAKARRYKAIANVNSVQLNAQHSGQKLRCEAKATYESDPPPTSVVASIPLNVIALEPVITCDKNVSARPGDLYVKISCQVEHSNVEVTAYSWEIGDSGEVVYPGNMTKDYDEVSVKELEEHLTEVTLDLYQTKEWHFDTVYYLDVYTKSGQRFRQKAQLVRLDPTGAASLLSVSKAAVLCVSFLLSLLLSL